MGNPSNGAPRINIATPKLAPELIPNIYGPASGFLNSVCICKPLTDSAAPHNSATTALISLIFITIFAVVSGQSPPTNAAHICVNGIDVAPTDKSMIDSAISNIANDMNNIVDFARIYFNF
jgi:hypothetical protein